jgi:cell division protein FtsB
MLVKFLLRISAAILVLLLAVRPLGAQTAGDKSESERLQKLERAVDQLQKRNAELEQEVNSLKKHGPFAPEFGPEGKTYVEKAPAERKRSPDLLRRHLQRQRAQL